MKVISFSNANHVGLLNLQRSMQPGWEHQIIGQGQVWVGWITRMKAYKEICESLPADELIVLCDAYDVLCLLPSDGFREAFESFQKPIVVGADDVCGGLNCHVPNNWWAENEITSHRKYCNGGLMAGYAKNLAEMWTYAVEGKFKDDQIAMGKYLDDNPDKVHLDMDCKLFFNDNYAETLLTFNAVDRSITVDNKTYKIFFIHFSGLNLRKSVPFLNMFSKELFKVGKNYSLIGSAVNGPNHLTLFPADKRGSVIGICVERGVLIGFAALFLVVAVALMIKRHR